MDVIFIFIFNIYEVTSKITKAHIT